MRVTMLTHKDRSVACPLVSREVIPIHGDDGRYRGMRYRHVGLAPSQHRSTSEIVDKEHRGDGHHEIDDADDAGGEKGDGVTGETDLLEDGRGVIDDS